ncbi:MAG: RagB/SusD family nutrient uptake outer membrane protein [Gemmatimonas sp.]
MRKQLSVLALLTLASAAVPACDDNKFLTEVPYDFVGATNFYQNAGDALAAISGVYATFINTTGDNYYGRNFVMLTEFPGDAVTCYLSATNERSLVDNYTFTPSHSYIYSVWQSAFGAINRANSVVDRVPGITMDATLKARIVGEAKFLRALNYFNLVRLFGGVPMHLTETTSLDSLALPRNTAAEVYTQIIKDLNDAIAALPAKATYTGSDIGRASKGAAKTLLAKVYLQRAGTGIGTAADFQLALTTANQVVSDGGYSLVPDIATLFNLSNENNAEVIFDIQNTRQQGLGGRIGNHMVPRNSTWGASQNGSFEAEQPFYDSYDVADKRKTALFVQSFPNKSGATVLYTAAATAAGTYGADTPYINKWIDPTLVTAGQEEPNYIVLRYADLLLMIAEASNEVNGGPNAEGLSAINLVRARAGLGPLTATLTKQQFKDAIFQERRWELAVEGPNAFFDSQRNWDWAKARVAANMALGKAAAFKNSKFPKAEVAIVDKFKLMPIPQRAIDLNKLITQNPGW